MSYKEEIIDYESYKEEIDKWIALKGEIKYMQFVDYLKTKNERIMWIPLRDTYRYDKRLLVNVFKYLSFFEEFLRAQIWNNSRSTYQELEQTYFLGIIDKAIDATIQYDGFDSNILKQNKDYINYLRNHVCHNKIMFNAQKDGMNIEQLLTMFANTLPYSHRSGFIGDINKCVKDLCIPCSISLNMIACS